MVAEHVYVIAGPEAVKIGLATNPRARLRALQTGHYHQLSLEYSVECAEGQAFQVEQCAHRLLREKRMKGEWFSVDVNEARNAIEMAMDGVRNELARTEHGAGSTVIRKKGQKAEKPWYEGWSFHPLYDIDFEVVRFLASHASNSGTLLDQQAEWRIPKSDLIRINPELAERDYEDTFWLRVFAFWFDYQNIEFQTRHSSAACFPKARIIDDVDFYTDEDEVEYALSYPATWVIAEHGMEKFMEIIKDQSEGYKQKDTAA